MNRSRGTDSSRACLSGLVGCVKRTHSSPGNPLGAFHAPDSSDIAVPAVAQDRIALDQLLDARIEGMTWPEPGGFDLGVGDDVVALVRILADGSLEEDESRQLLADLGAQLQLREIGITEAH